MKDNQNVSLNEFDDELEESSIFSFNFLFSLFVLNWKWFVLSVVVCLAGSMLYLRYQTPIYMSAAKVFIKGENNSRGSRSSLNVSNLGTITNTEGIANEMEILKSKSIALDAVKRLKLYITYRYEGRFVDRLVYKTQPVTVELDAQSVDALQSPISLVISYENGNYQVTGQYTMIHKERGAETRNINAKLPVIPARIRTAVGYLTFLRNTNSTAHMKDGQKLLVSVVPPANAAAAFAGRLGISQVEETSIAQLTMTDEEPSRAQDYLEQLMISYNDEANRDKNIVAVRTEEFINSRLEKINAELGMTEGQLESFKRQNRMLDLNMTASNAFGQSTNYDQKIADMNTQLALFNSIGDYMNDPSNRYQTLPSNVGLTDQAASSLINTYNQIVLERNKLLRTANENSPSVIPLTEQLNDLTSSIRRAMSQARNNFEIQRNSMQSQFSKYNAQVQQSPAQERILNQIGRQQEVRSGLYLMLLQKREENSVSLAATADKGKLIDAPSFVGKIYPNDNKIIGGSLAAGFFAPLLILILLQLMRYKIEGHDDVARITKLPIVADIPVASESAKTRADIVVHENENNLMEEVFRSLRTNMTFMMKENQKVILFTSSTSGEGKTFIAANLAMSFAMLNKKVVLVGLDIRRPRLAELFGVKQRDLGITSLLNVEDPNDQMVRQQIVPSEINGNLDLLLAGPIPPNPAEIVTRPSLDKVFEILRTQYDYVIVDTAPVGLVTDTLSIGRVADASVYVCRADYTPKSSLEQVNEYAQSNKLPNISLVINGIDLSVKKYGYYYGYGKYGKYGRYGRYGRYSRYGHYGRYGNYSTYGNYSYSHYGKKNDTSIKL